MLTSSGVRTTAASLEAAVERRLSAAESLGRTEGLETAAAYELDLITAGEAVAQQGSGSGAAVATASAATSDAATVVAAALNAAATSDAGSIAFERIASASASASASSFWMKTVPSASTALTGPAWSVRCLSLGWAHASAKVLVGCEVRWARGGWGCSGRGVWRSCRSVRVWGTHC
jgi:hypothetical protein